jgi:hypothetical protein
MVSVGDRHAQELKGAKSRSVSGGIIAMEGASLTALR